MHQAGIDKGKRRKRRVLNFIGEFSEILFETMSNKYSTPSYFYEA
jgi:hypothetical protein